MSYNVMADNLGRKINYLRLSVTDRCNLRCLYCMPEAGTNKLESVDILRYDEVLRLVRIFAAYGVSAVRLTGGEPTIRKGLIELVGQLAKIPGITDLSMTTNALTLAKTADSYRQAGITRVNISLDTLRPERFARITRGGQLPAVLAGVDAAISVGLLPVKLNVVLLKGFNTDEIADFIAFSARKPLAVRFIEYMPTDPLLQSACRACGEYVSVDEAVLPYLQGHTASPQTLGRGPARYFQRPGDLGRVGLIGAVSHKFCDGCNKLRLTADGRLRLCLFADCELDLRALLRKGASDAEIVAEINAALASKPTEHNLLAGGQSGVRPFNMHRIGG